MTFRCVGSRWASASGRSTWTSIRVPSPSSASCQTRRCPRPGRKRSRGRRPAPCAGSAAWGSRGSRRPHRVPVGAFGAHRLDPAHHSGNRVGSKSSFQTSSTGAGVRLVRVKRAWRLLERRRARCARRSSSRAGSTRPTTGRQAEVDQRGHQVGPGSGRGHPLPGGERLGEPAACGRHVATGQGDESLGPGHARHQGPGLVAAAHRFERGAAQLAGGLGGTARAGEGLDQSEPGGGPADGRIAVERRGQQPAASRNGRPRARPALRHLGQGDERAGSRGAGPAPGGHGRRRAPPRGGPNVRADAREPRGRAA